MKIYFVRHGKTQWNLEKRLQGQKGDSPLLPESY
ncbi:MAG: histidine phosphatase family protein, partial [Lactococcus garvieae]